ncbi:hypothetical protein B7P33_07890 [Sediminicola luteus]|uniref:Uncharacterized protein n=1 Tax=Sediminicola luteus TaxID=319238 RepID=A0A2A4G898_9FLAO|nr:hypothetical protein B7P33_07890 [Sediminicola luteus]
MRGRTVDPNLSFRVVFERVNRNFTVSLQIISNYFLFPPNLLNFGRIQMILPCIIPQQYPTTTHQFIPKP